MDGTYKRIRSRRYLEWIRRQPCCVTGRPAEAHHVKTRGAGGSDYTAIPLCREEHEEIHRVGRVTYAERKRISYSAIIFDHLTRYIRELEAT